MIPRLNGHRVWHACRSLLNGAALLAAACSEDSTAPSLSLVGTWDFVGFSDGGVAAVATGTWVFRTDHTFSVDGTITYPDEPTEEVLLAGTYSQSGTSVTLTAGGETSAWLLAVNGNQVTLTQDEPPPANVITLRSR